MALLKKNGILFLSETKIHVGFKSFQKIVKTAYGIGFKKHSDYKVFGSRTILLTV